MPPWAFISWFLIWQELNNVTLGYQNTLDQCGEWESAFDPSDADLFDLGGTRWVTPLTMKIGVAWTVDVKLYVESGRWYLVPLLAIEHDHRLTVVHKDVCNKLEFAAIVAKGYQNQLCDIQWYEEERVTWSKEENVGYGQVESDESIPVQWIGCPNLTRLYFTTRT